MHHSEQRMECRGCDDRGEAVGRKSTNTQRIHPSDLLDITLLRDEKVLLFAKSGSELILCSEL
jgi:hypothetical protein